MAGRLVQDGIDVDRVDCMDDHWDSILIVKGVSWTIFAELLGEDYIEEVTAGIEQETKLVSEGSQDWLW